MLEQNLGVILLTASKSATDGVEPKQFRRLNRRWGKMLIFERACPLGDGARRKTL